MKSAGLSSDTIDLFRSIFRQLDLDGNGTIDNDEMFVGLKKVQDRTAENQHLEQPRYPLTKEIIDLMIEQLDTDNDGSINFTGV